MKEYYRNMKKFVFFVCLFIIGFNLYSQNTQSVYTLDLRRDIVLSTLAVATFVTPFFINDDRELTTNLDRNDVNAFDRWLMFPYNRGLNNARTSLAFVGMASTFIPPLILGWGERTGYFSTWLTYGVMFTQAFLFQYGTRNIIGRTVHRYRPHMYFELNQEFVPQASRRSFPSTTASTVFMSATFLHVTFSAEFPDSSWKIPVIVGSYTFAAGVSATRIFSGFHYLTDVLAGAAIGSLFGWLIPTLHLRADNDIFSLIPSGNGLMVSIRF